MHIDSGAGIKGAESRVIHTAPNTYYNKMKYVFNKYYDGDFFAIPALVKLIVLISFWHFDSSGRPTLCSAEPWWWFGVVVVIC